MREKERLVLQHRLPQHGVRAASEQVDVRQGVGAKDRQDFMGEGAAGQNKQELAALRGDATRLMALSAAVVATELIAVTRRTVSELAVVSAVRVPSCTANAARRLRRVYRQRSSVSR